MIFTHGFFETKMQELTLKRCQCTESSYKKTLHFNSSDAILPFVSKLWPYNDERDLCPLESRQVDEIQLIFTA